MKITKLGHCCLVIEIRGTRFLTDPGSYTTAQNEAKNIDCIVVSHEHTDHLHVESLKTVLKNNPGAVVISNASVGKILEKESIPYTCVAHKQSTTVKGVAISGEGLKHAPIYTDYEQVENTGYFFDGKLFYPGDAFYKPESPVDILAFPVTAPWCKISEAMDYVLDVKPRVAFPVHDGNLVRQNGITVRLPGIFLPKAGIQFIALELGKETEL
ncbi:MAG TPA: MBL fold metallo-hydrolase [Candidatus Paceibacterota bacterium]